MSATLQAVPREPLVARLPELLLESGVTVNDVAVAYHRDGPHDAPVVVVIHALTGTPDAHRDWWPLVVGPGKAVDTTRVQVISPNLIGSCYGSTGPTNVAGHFPAVTTRDQARAIAALLTQLGITELALVTGGSLGGMVALELSASNPTLARSTVVFAAPAAHTAWAIGFNHVQRAALDALGGGRAGLALARRIAMLSYRAEPGLEDRFGRATNEEGAWRIGEWLDTHGEKLVARFDAASYRVLLDAMDSHDVGRGRGGIELALRAIRGRLVGVGVSTDVLYSSDVVQQWTELAGASYIHLTSPHGHDAFLIEQHHVGQVLARELQRAVTATAPLVEEVAA
jgi:homoserine O-acetyltransferase